jgi:hypothetical protein
MDYVGCGYQPLITGHTAQSAAPREAPHKAGIGASCRYSLAPASYVRGDASPLRASDGWFRACSSQR